MQNGIEKANKLAEEILALSRNTLLINLRFLDVALSRLKHIPIASSAIMTNGQGLFYNPIYVLQSYKRQRELPARNYLHIIMHCIFRHMYFSNSIKQIYWDLACDIAVENSINELHLNAIETENVKRQIDVIENLHHKVPKLTAEIIYRYLRNQKLSAERVNELREIFVADDHDIWYSQEGEPQNNILSEQSGDGENNSKKQSGDGENNSKKQSGGGENNSKKQSGDGENNSKKQSGGREAVSAMRGRADEEAAEDWKSIAQSIQMDLETFNKERGTQAGDMLQNLREVTRERYDYTKFLKKFMVTGEVMQINDEEFDYIFYTHGMRLYKNMPLIEPLEYKDVKRIREFVIVIDTSGSVSGELVQLFLQKTYNILKSEETFFRKINLHIIQCDARIQEDAKITSQDEFDKYIRTMKIRGLGGTDFRPTFEYVERLREGKEFVNLQGLVYFTDGLGEFPAKKPDYKTAVVFIESGQNSYDVPPWAIKVVLKKEEV